MENYVLWTLLHQTSDAMLRAWQKELNLIGITTEQAAALFVIQAIQGPATPAEISRWLFRQPHTVFGLLNRMEKDGLVTQTKDLERKNLVRVALTPKGRQCYDASTKREVISRIFSFLSKEQRRMLASYLEVLRNKALEELTIKRKLSFS